MGANFSIVFPARPITKTAPGEGGVVWKFLSLDRSKTSGRIYNVEYMKRVEDNFWNRHAYGDRLMRMQHATVHQRWEYQLGGYPVSEGIFTQQWGLNPHYYRFMNMGTADHFYIVWVKAKSVNDLKGVAVRRFFRSFKLSGKYASQGGRVKPNNGMQRTRNELAFYDQWPVRAADAWR